MAAREDEVFIRVPYPDWLHELSLEERGNVLKLAEKKARSAWCGSLDTAHQVIMMREHAKLEGQMDIYDVAREKWEEVEMTPEDMINYAAWSAEHHGEYPYSWEKNA